MGSHTPSDTLSSVAVHKIYMQTRKELHSAPCEGHGELLQGRNQTGGCFTANEKKKINAGHDQHCQALVLDELGLSTAVTQISACCEDQLE